MSNGIKKDTLESESVRQGSVRLDETVKLLFEVSKELLVKTINSLFNENFDVDSVEIDKTATEYPTNELDLLHADIFIKIIIVNDKPNHFNFHIEIQTKPDDMAFRAFEYAMMKACGNYRLQGQTNGETIIFMPKSIIIQIEDGKSVPQDCYNAKLVKSNGDIIEFAFPVMRYFDYDKDRLIRENLYTLLPLQIYMLRDELDRMTAKGDEQARQKAILKARDLTYTIAKDIMNLNNEKKISAYDVNRTMLALQELFTHLNNRYQVNEKLNMEVRDMVRTLISDDMLKKLEQLEQVEKQIKKLEQSKIESITKMLLNKEPINKIIDYTGATEQEIQDVQKKLNKN